MKGSVRSVGVAVVATLVVSGCASQSEMRTASVSGRSTIRTDVAVDALLLEMKDIPSSITVKLSLRSQHPAFKGNELLDQVGEAKEFRIRSWVDKDGDRPVTQIVYALPDVTKAKAEYQGTPYGRHFNISDGLRAIPVDFSGSELKADEARVFCVDSDIRTGQIDDCAQWGSRSRYGRYVVDVVYRRGIDRRLEISKGLFLELVAAVDHHVEIEIGD